MAWSQLFCRSRWPNWSINSWIVGNFILCRSGPRHSASSTPFPVSPFLDHFNFNSISSWRPFASRFSVLVFPFCFCFEVRSTWRRWNGDDTATNISLGAFALLWGTFFHWGHLQLPLHFQLSLRPHFHLHFPTIFSAFLGVKVHYSRTGLAGGIIIHLSICNAANWLLQNESKLPKNYKK